MKNGTDRRTNRSKNKQVALTSLLDYTRMKGGFTQTIIVNNDGEVVASSTPIGDAATLAPVAGVLQQAACSMAGHATFKHADTIVIQASQGQSIACHYFKHSFDGAVMATIEGKMPASAEKILCNTAEGTLRILAEKKRK